MSAAMLPGGASGDQPTTLQLATIKALIGSTWYAQIDGSDTLFTLNVDQNPSRVPYVNDRIVVTRVGSQMYEVALVDSGATNDFPTPFADYYLAADTPIASSVDTRVLFNANRQFPVGFAAPVSGVFTVPTAGLYCITTKVSFTASSTGGAQRVVMVWVNGVEETRNSTPSSFQSTNNTIPVVYFKHCVPGDTIEIHCLHNQGASLNILGTSIYSMVQIAKVGG